MNAIHERSSAQGGGCEDGGKGGTTATILGVVSRLLTESFLRVSHSD